MSNPGVTTLQVIREKVLQRIDRVGDDFFPADELNGWISDSYKELYDILLQKFGNDYYAVLPFYTFTTNGTSDQYPLPADFYKGFGVDLSLTGGNPSGWVTLKQFMMAERNRYAVPNFQSFYGITNMRYRFLANTIWFTPIPQGGQQIRLIYSPRPNDLTADDDTVDGVSGWEEYIICDVAMKCLGKEESDPSLFIKQKADMLMRIEAAAENRNQGLPQTVSDNQNNWGPFGGWGDGGGNN